MTAFLIHIAILICIFIILAVSLNVALGYTGMINLGHIAFFGVGAYTSAILTTRHDIHFLIALLVAGILASIAGFILTVITNRLKGDYFALATLGFGFVVYSLMLNWTDLTRGPLGIPGISRPEIFGYKFATNTEYLILVAIITAIVVFLIHRLVNSRYGKLLEAVRDDAIGIAVLGKNYFRLKYQAMGVSAFFAGVAGSLFAHFISFIDPSTFFLNDIVIIFTVVIVGGLASVRGSVIAAIIMILIPELLRFVDLPSSIIGPSRQIFYALILLAILMFRPKGLFGRVDLE